MKATEVLRQDHAAISALIDELIRAADDQQRRALMAEVATALEIHAQIEEELFYPPLAALSGLIPEVRREHAQIRTLIRNIDQQDQARGKRSSAAR